MKDKEAVMEQIANLRDKIDSLTTLFSRDEITEETYRRGVKKIEEDIRRLQLEHKIPTTEKHEPSATSIRGTAGHETTEETPYRHHPDLRLAIPVILYLPILVLSYSAVFFNPPLTLLGLILVPVAGNFIVGFLKREPDVAAKIIIACFLLHATVALGLLAFNPVYSQALSAWWRYASMETSLIPPTADPFVLTVIMTTGYPMMHIVLGIPISFLGLSVRDILNPR